MIFLSFERLPGICCMILFNIYKAFQFLNFLNSSGREPASDAWNWLNNSQKQTLFVENV